MAQQPDKKYIGGFISSELHASLIRMSTRTGNDPMTMVAEYILRGIREDLEILSKDGKLPIELEIYRRYVGTKQTQNMRFQLLQIVSHAITSNNTDEMDGLDKICADAGYLLTELIKEVADTGIVNPGIYVEESENVARARAFLRNLLTNGDEVLVVDIKEKAKKAEISFEVLESLKTGMNIKSVKYSANKRVWAWVLSNTDRMMSVK